MLAPRAQLEAAERQLMVFAREIKQLYQAERACTAALEDALGRLGDAYLDTVRTLAFVVEAKDPSTRAHLERTHDYAVALTHVVDPELAGDQTLRYGFLLHDIGKIGVPEAILNKPGPLDPEEWEAMRAHPLIGVQIVSRMRFLGDAVDVIRSHHERWDGRGYPSGLRAGAIPIGARIFSVCDAFDAMTSDRPYRRALPLEHALQQIRTGAGSQFDPAVVEAFLSIAPGMLELHASLHAAAARPLAVAPAAE
jgi:putative nucleotidyltransferase with HDIG domain